MINKYNTLFVSLFVHGILLYLLSNVKVPKMKQLETTAIEVYMISIEANSKSESDAIELAHINKPKIIESTETTIRVKTKYFEEQKKTTLIR
ncbi:hypothetical protein [Pseudoalteromonas sp. B62]|uniref:hypothetical protein n=1 Tax=Pseudoalteromonas sp. B62 TaxID=630483 RepID=UPI00301BABA8